MPNCFQLISKATGEAEKFSKIDDEMCAHLGVQPDPKHWYKGWYDFIGASLASGKDWAYCRETFTDVEDVIAYLEERYTPTCWYEHKSSRS